MKKIKKFIKNNIKLVIGIMIGLAIAGSIGVYAATVIASKDVTYSNTTSGLTATTVQGAIDEIYKKAKPTEFKVGDYVSMTPTKTTFTVPMTLTGDERNQTINPRELKLWRVIRINSDGTIEMISKNVSSVAVRFRGATGYQNFVGTLNYIAKQYENQRYTSGSRHMGYSNQTEYITNKSALTATTSPQTSSTSSSNVTSATEAKGLGDMGYETDYNLVKTACGTVASNGNYWIASRNYSGGNSSWSFEGRYINNSAKILSDNMVRYGYMGSPGYSTHGYEYAIRPIVILKSGVKALGGSGTSSSPYVLS